MKFIEQILIEEEEIIKEIKLDIYQYIIPFLHLLLSLALFLMYFVLSHIAYIELSLVSGVFFFIISIYKYLLLKSNERAVTNFRVIEKKGLFSTNQNEVQFRSMETAEIKQSILDKILNTGSIELTATGGANLTIKDIENPIEVLKAINTIQMKKSYKSNKEN